MRTLFYSWQSDLPNSTNRGFIEECIERALKELGKEDGVKVFEPDRDTQGTSGSPNIAETIFAKIDKCSAFVADVSFINGARTDPDNGSMAAACDGSCTRLTPNPNVMAEWGWACRSVGFERVICVLNETTGSIDDLPFDMRHRRVVRYKLSAGEEKIEARKALVSTLKDAIRAILGLPQAMLDLQFADPDTHQQLGRDIRLANVRLLPEMDYESIPSYGVSSSERFDLARGFTDLRLNRHYFRERYLYLLASNTMRRVALRLTNTGSQLMSNVRLAATVRKIEGQFVMEEHEMAKPPKKDDDRMPDLPPIRSVWSRDGNVDIATRGDEYRLDVFFGNVQAQASQVSDVFCIGSLVEPKIDISGLLFADELPEPIPATLSVTFETADRPLTLDELVEGLPTI
ncbi:MAG TPA: hypothetical protein VJ783_06670 [Pirellulales bacterium]|nr:hypothetical protein [Pirellulales bacterium]